MGNGGFESRMANRYSVNLALTEYRRACETDSDRKVKQILDLPENDAPLYLMPVGRAR
jgi:hypothetical protein